MAVVLSVCDVTYLAPEVHVAFIGIKGKESMVQTIKVDTPITVAKSITVKEILLEAACARFSTTSEVLLDPEGFHLDEAVVYRSTALGMAPQTKLADIEAPVIIESQNDTDPMPMKPLFLIAHIPIAKLASERASAAYKLYGVLKMEASIAGIALSDTKFAGICGLTCAAFSKALGRVKSSPTPSDGNAVMKLESRIMAYRADLDGLRRDLNEHDAAKDLVGLVAACLRAQDLRPSYLLTCAWLPYRQRDDILASPPTTLPPGPNTTPVTAPAAAEPEPAAAKLPVKVAFGKTADVFLAPFVSKWIADEHDRPGRVATVKAILAAVETEVLINSAGWTEKNLACHLKKLAHKARRV